MKTILIFLAVSLISSISCSGGSAPQPSDWISKPQISFTQNDKVPENSYAEVCVTKIIPAVSSLKEISAIPLSEEMAKYYAGSMFKIEEGKTPYLVRGLFANYTGRHTLFFRDGTLLVRHDSLGSSFEPKFCPIVVNLSSEPKNVFVVIGGAK